MAAGSTSIEQQARARIDLGLIGLWRMDEGYQVTELLFRSDGKYQLDVRSTTPDLSYASSEPGEYSIDGNRLTLAPYEYFGEPYKKAFALAMKGGSLTLTTAYETTQETWSAAGRARRAAARERYG